MGGRFITFEGGEGTGKSTQLTRLKARIEACGHSVLATREPGGTAGAEALRALLVQGEAGRWSPLSEALLMYAGRNDHLERVIRPALARGDWVLCDRFADSTRAYQSEAGLVSADLIEALDRSVVGESQPHLTLIFMLPHSEGLKRALARGGAENRFESKGEAFHARLSGAWEAIAARYPERCVLIDGSGTADEIEARVWAVVEARLNPCP